MSEPVPVAAVLEGRLIRLEPMAAEHIGPLLSISSRWPEEYALTSTPVNDEQARSYFETAFTERDAGRAYPYTIFHQESGDTIGSTRLTGIRWHHKNCELGYTWFRPDMHGSGANVESKLLLLQFAFERLGLLRVKIITDTRNIRSQRAIEALGAVFEGVLRRHMIVKEGYIRDSRMYAITDLDWPQVKERLRSRLRARGVEPTV